MKLITNVKLLKKKELKQRINITIEPSVNRDLTEFSIKNNISKSDVIWLALVNYFQMWNEENDRQTK